MINIHSFVFSPFSENTYVLFDETHEAVIIDPGCLAQYEKEELADFIFENNGNLEHLYTQVEEVLEKIS